ncbi:MAG: hypothetical protein H0U60_19620 [Blastocatellia bacterium]|nr:hypothetical protein [Blastocatellia bacterium]
MSTERETLATVGAKQAIKRLIEVLAAKHIPAERWVNVTECVIDTDEQTVTLKYECAEYFPDDFPEDGYVS